MLRSAAALAIVAACIAVAPPVGASSSSLEPLASPPTSKPARSLTAAGGATMRGGAARLRPPSSLTPNAAPAPDWCPHGAGGPAGSHAVAVDLSAAHALAREFGTDSAFGPADAALVASLPSAGDLTPSGVAAALAAYDAQLPDVCALPAANGALGPGRLDMVGRVAIVTPGTSPPAIPTSAQVVVVDLRALPAVDGLDAALAASVRPVLTSPIDRPGRWERGHFGPVDEAFSATNVYATFVNLDEQQPIAGGGQRDVPIVLLTSDRMPPAAVEFAGALRLAGRAWILGSDVLSAVGESAWRGVGDSGALVRTAMFDRTFRPAPPQVLRSQPAQQNDPYDPTTASYRRDVVVSRADTERLRVSTAGRPGTDLDLYLLFDVNGDGSFTFPDEVIAASGGPTADEQIDLLGPPVGHYQAWVHGFQVPVPQGTRFDLTIDLLSGQLWPDVIPADLRSSGGSLSQIAADVRRVTVQTSPPVQGPVARTFPFPVDPFGQQRPVTTAKPELRAALLIVHGITRMFFPYFGVVGDGIDARLVETLGAVEAWNGTDRRAAMDILRRFGEVLHDGHQFVFNFGPPVFAGFIPVRVEEVAGRPAVRRSADPVIHPGDTITAIDGRPIEDIYADQYRLTSTATHGYQFDVASRSALGLTGPASVTLVDPVGAVRTVTVQPAPRETFQAVNDPGATDRPSGPLTDLGRPDVYYLNVNLFTSPDGASIRTALADAAARGSRAMVVDMRGYPGANHYEVAQRLIPAPFSSAQFIEQLRLGPDVSFPIESQYDLGPLDNPSFAGPIALLVGPHTVSAAENFSQMLVGAHRPAVVVGQRSAGTNGNITAVQLPGGFAFSYTGMQVLNPDGSRFHGVGIIPDITVPVTAVDLRDGVDRDLMVAAAALG